MSSESLLENPALFSKEIHDLDRLAMEYIRLAEKYNHNPKYARPHLFKMLYQGLSNHIDLRDKMGRANGYDQCLEIVQELSERRKNVNLIDKFGWYLRYFKPLVESKRALG